MGSLSAPPLPSGSVFNLSGLGRDQSELLDLLDKVQFAQIGGDILPQIIVVGDQSSGKSSALTSLTGIHFARHQKACTRYATEIRLRRNSPVSRVRVWIVPDESRRRGDKENQELQQFAREIQETPERIRECMEAASKLIVSQNRSTFAFKDKLVIEKSGPDLPLLTLVDLPGLVLNANEQQTKEDIQMIEALSELYMKNPATVILAVVSGAYQFVQAQILDKVVALGVGSRTIGILTKPDMADREGLTDEYIDLITKQDTNAKYHFKLGWHVLLNPDFKSNPTMDERIRHEASFWAGKWASALPASMRGADTLRARLSLELQRAVVREIPAIQRSIQEAEDKNETQLKALGKVLTKPKEKLIELARLFGLSNQLVLEAAKGHYTNPPDEHFFKDERDPKGIPPRNLRARVVAESSEFERQFRQFGLQQRFVTGKDGKPDAKAKRKFAKKEVEPLLPQIIGTQLPGDSNTRAPYMVFRQHSRDWPVRAQEYQWKVAAACQEFLGEVTEYAWPPTMRSPLEEQFLKEKMAAILSAAKFELHQLNKERYEIQPFDPEYLACLEDAVKTYQGEDEAARPMTEAERVVEQMLAYYKIAESVFVRNVIYQVAERHLLRGMLRIFDPTEVAQMEEKKIDDITAVSKEAQEERKRLEQEKKRIEDARDVCNKILRRKKDLQVGYEVGVSRDADAGAASGDDDFELPSGHRTENIPVTLFPSSSEDSQPARATDDEVDSELQRRQQRQGERRQLAERRQREEDERLERLRKLEETQSREQDRRRQEQRQRQEKEERDRVEAERLLDEENRRRLEHQQRIQEQKKLEEQRQLKEQEERERVREAEQRLREENQRKLDQHQREMDEARKKLEAQREQEKRDGEEKERQDVIRQDLKRQQEDRQRQEDKQQQREAETQLREEKQRQLEQHQLEQQALDKQQQREKQREAQRQHSQQWQQEQAEQEIRERMKERNRRELARLQVEALEEQKQRALQQQQQQHQIQRDLDQARKRSRASLGSQAEPQISPTRTSTGSQPLSPRHRRSSSSTNNLNMPLTPKAVQQTIPEDPVPDDTTTRKSMQLQDPPATPEDWAYTAQDIYLPRGSGSGSGSSRGQGFNMPGQFPGDEDAAVDGPQSFGTVWTRTGGGRRESGSQPVSTGVREARDVNGRPYFAQQQNSGSRAGPSAQYDRPTSLEVERPKKESKVGRFFKRS
ncbi:hypothetical protein B0T26DRAFT_871331 [Lasiosphaeria miniovina]|uniref:GED domain-containing protein n=1 Tax=Lasiosphaeria miniovina TaxID=1954250 RepID=A0AA40AX15_9PEZI|nr:uncharacterized protein B0T26DRAFT_871331 [Lasiosphaeria miniovina]KAK0723511.1 hypothetical protein B0T26DRAFT_871331 [Lasiosphaeria miniovina]